MEDKNKLQQQEVNKKAVQKQMKKDLLGGMLKEAGLTDKEIDDTLENDVKEAAEDLVMWSEEDVKDFESAEFKEWEEEEKLKQANREKRKREW